VLYFTVSADLTKIDLHTHTTASDGALPPAELLRKAASVGIGTLAITDHDTVAALSEALPVARQLGVRLVPGVEFGAYVNGVEVHMLGYLFNPGHPTLLQKLQELREGRLDRGKLMVSKLNALGVGISWERVEQIATGESVGRPHVAQALIEAGYAASVDDAFDKYLGRGRPAYVERTQLSPEACIALIHQAGGVAVLAHPTWVRNVEELLPDIVAAGLDGIETYYGVYGPDIITWLEGLARQFDLVPTGGSDYHGFEGLAHAELGSVSVPPECFAELELRANRQQAVHRGQ
jgi:predicted metal-dependent phosphoesterase TrpH